VVFWVGRINGTKTPVFFWGGSFFCYRNPAIQVTREGSTSTVVSTDPSQGAYLEDRAPSEFVSMVNNYNVSKSPRPGVVLDPFHSWPKFRAYKWGVAPTTYESWDDPPSSGSLKDPWGVEQIMWTNFRLKNILRMFFFKLCTLEETKDQDLLTAFHMDLPNISGT